MRGTNEGGELGMLGHSSNNSKEWRNENGVGDIKRGLELLSSTTPDSQGKLLELLKEAKKEQEKEAKDNSPKKAFALGKGLAESPKLQGGHDISSLADTVGNKVGLGGETKQARIMTRARSGTARERIVKRKRKTTW